MRRGELTEKFRHRVVLLAHCPRDITSDQSGCGQTMRFVDKGLLRIGSAVQCRQAGVSLQVKLEPLGAVLAWSPGVSHPAAW